MKKEKKIHLVYKVTNQETGETYIGATTKSIEERKADHLQKASKGIGSYFQEAIGTYGPNAFIWEQIDTANSVNELAEKEKKYILQYNSKEKGYNSDSGGGFKKRVYEYDCHGNWTTTHKCLKDIEELNGFDRRRISYACLNGTPYDCCFWSYSKDTKFNIYSDPRKKVVFQYDLQENFLDVFSSVAEASIFSGISKTCISRCCRGERKQSGGFRWTYDG
jgi:hypothetical protein